MLVYDSHHSYTEGDMQRLLESMGSVQVKKTVRDEAWTWEGSCPRASCSSTHDAFHAKLKARSDGTWGIVWYCRKCQNEGRNFGGWLDQLDGKMRPKAPAKRITTSSITTQYKLKTSDAIRLYYQQPDYVKDYIKTNRALPNEVRDACMLGYSNTGNPFVSMNRFSIPNFSPDGQLFGVALRRDDTQVEKLIMMQGEDVYENGIKEMEKIRQNPKHKDHGKPITHRDYIDYTYPKYSAITGSQVAPFNQALLRYNKSLPFVFITEDQFSAMTLISLGYPAMAWKRQLAWENYAPYMFSKVCRVAMPIVIADNDSDGIGRRLAIEVSKAIGKGLIIETPSPWNDINDMWKSTDLRTIKNFLKHEPLWDRIENQIPPYLTMLKEKIECQL